MSTVDNIFATSITDNQTKQTKTIESLFNVSNEPSYSGYRTGFIGIKQPITTKASDSTIDIAEGDFLYRDVSDPLNPTFNLKVVPAISGFTPSNLGGTVQTSYLYADLINLIYVDSDKLPSEAPNHFSYIGNIDYIQTTVPHDTIQGVNIFISTSYSESDTNYKVLVNRGDYNLYGCVYGAGTGLTLSHTEGSGVRMGANTHIDTQLPDTPISPVDSINLLARGYIDVNGDLQIDFPTPFEVDPTMYNDSGVLSSVNSTKFTIQYIYHFYGSDVTFIYYGDLIFNTLEEAISAITPLGAIVESPITKEAQLRSALIVKGDATDLSDPAQARFIEL